MALRISLSFVLCFISILVQAQSPAGKTISGRIVSADSNEPLGYATIYNTSQNKGTISDAEGYFEMDVGGPGDNIEVSFIGYHTYTITVSENRDQLIVRLEPAILELGEVIVKPEDDEYLYELLHQCARRRNPATAEAKAYYALKTFRDENQLELVESYQNLNITGYDVASMEMKAGRLALQPQENLFFASLESSWVILQTRLFEESKYFPVSPLSLSRRKLKKFYFLDLLSSYETSSGDSIFHIAFTPRDKSGRYFSGSVWIDKYRAGILKLELNCPEALRHPFRPLFPEDNIDAVGMHITKTFKLQNEDYVFEHIDFDYTVDYASRKIRDSVTHYRVNAHAVLHAYDYHDTFFTPLFDFDKDFISDYRKINAFPYNTFFWQYQDDFKLRDFEGRNAAFYYHPNSFNSQTIFGPDSKFRKGFFEHPFIPWSEDRVFFREVIPDSLGTGENADFVSDRYNLSVIIFVDINTLRDSTHLLTSTIFDPYKSFYHLELNKSALCFINMYFDLCELQRRELKEGLDRYIGEGQDIEQFIMDKMESFEEERKLFLHEVDHGTIMVEMKKWNDILHRGTGIDNIAVFNPYDDNQ